MAHARAGRIHTIAGNGTPGYAGDHGPARQAELRLPSEVAPVPGGGYLIADKKNARIRKVSRRGRIRTVAGTGTFGYNGDGIRATQAELSFPTGVAPLRHGAFLIADSGNERVRKVNRNGIIHTVAGNGVQGYNGDNRKAKTAELNYPARVVPTGQGGFLFTDFLNNRVRKVTPHGIIKAVAGDGTAASGGDGGPAKQAQIYGPSTAVPTPDGGILISEFGLLGSSTNVSRIRKVNRHGIIHTVAGIGTDGFSGDGHKARHAMLDHPASAVPTPDGGFLIADMNNNRIRKVNRRGIIHTVAGNGTQGFGGDGGPAKQAELNNPVCAVPTRHGGFLLCDFGNNRIRKVDGHR
jgi:hypothetical protein